MVEVMFVLCCKWQLGAESAINKCISVLLVNENHKLIEEVDYFRRVGILSNLPT